jgi:hypothetical protein
VRLTVREAWLRIIASGNVYFFDDSFISRRVWAADFLRELRWLSTKPAPFVSDQPDVNASKNASREKFSETHAVEHD